MLAPFYGSLADRHGARTVALWSLLAFGLIFASFALIPNNLWIWWAAWFVLGLISIGATPLTWTRGIGLWFFRQRGLALGLALMGTSLSGMAIPKIAAYSVENFGWRYTFPVLACLPLLVALPIAWRWFHEPRAEQCPVELTSPAGLTGLTMREAIRDRRFWLIFASIVCISLAYAGAYVHLKEMLLMKGFKKTVATNIVVSMSAAILLTLVFTGFLLDRIWAPLVALPLLSAPAIACLLLAGNSLSMPPSRRCCMAGCATAPATISWRCTPPLAYSRSVQSCRCC